MRKGKSISGQRSYITSLIGKTAGDNIVRFISRMNQHISDSRTQVSTCKFPIHVCKCGLKSKCLNEPFFEINLMMKLRSSKQHITMSKWKMKNKSWIYNLFMPHKQYNIQFKGFLLQVARAYPTLTKFWLHLLVDSSTASFKKLNSLTLQISISQYSVCNCSILLSFPLTF